MNKAIIKYNNGQGAILCSGCRIILQEGSQITEQDWKLINSKEGMPAQFCEKCKKEKE